MRKADFELTDKEIDFFHEEGYLILPPITSRQEAAYIERVFDRVAVELGNLTGGYAHWVRNNISPLLQLSMPFFDAPELFDTHLRANASAIAMQLLGPAANFAGEQAMIKPPYHTVVTPWHQDEAYWNGAFEFTAITIWVTLEDIGPEHGCLQFVPRSHKGEVIPHRCIPTDTNEPELAAIDPDVSEAVAPRLEAGSATVHWSKTLHGAGPNHTGVPRCAYSLGYDLPPRERDTPRNFTWQE